MSFSYIGIFKAIHVVLHDFWLPCVTVDMKPSVSSYTCHHAKYLTRKPSVLLHLLPSSPGSWDIVSWDF